VGEIKGKWLTEEQKVDILDTIEWGKGLGISATRSCEMWRINRRRVVRWNREHSKGNSLYNRKPGSIKPVHRLLPAEKRAVLQMAGMEEYADLSHRTLAVTAWEREDFFVSFSSVYRILSSDNLMSMRGKHRAHNGRSLPPVRKELTGPNQRWCWDISYLYTFEKGLFLYLYLLLDEYSRKAISWLVSWYLTAEEAKQLLEVGMINENILDLPEDKRPEVVNDRGRQMKAKIIQEMFKDNHMPQLFARPRTPNDNPFIESAFGTAKGRPEYPGRFLDLICGKNYFDQYFLWYNTKHFHSGIDYVTPEQCHQGLREDIVARRHQKHHLQREKRKKINRAGLSLNYCKLKIETPAEMPFVV
jgi:transposase InsO family protein